MVKVITVNQPMVLVPLKEYEMLLKESGEEPTPKLAQEIRRARKEFCSGKTKKWEQLKRELSV